MANVEIPLSATPQKFSITLSGVAYQLTVLWRNADMGGWVVDIADSSGAAIIQGIPLVTGTNLLEQYEYLGLGGVLWCQTTDSPDSVPTFENLGTGSHLYWYTE